MNHRYTSGIFLGATLVLALVVACNNSSGGSGGSGPDPLTYTSGPALPAGEVGTAYSTVITVSGGILPYLWSLDTPTTFPPGLTLNTSTGDVAGNPSLDGIYPFDVTVSDSSNPVQMITDTFIIDVLLPAAPQVVINEVWGDHCHTGGEFVELLNIGTGAADLSNWTLEVYNNSTGGLNGAYAIPVGTMLPAGGLLVLWENTGTDTPTTLYVGFDMDSDWLPGAPGCTGVDLSEVVLLDDTGTGVDYVAINDIAMANLPANLTFTATFSCPNHDAYRTSQADTDQPSDFSCGGLGSGTPGLLNPGQ